MRQLALLMLCLPGCLMPPSEAVSSALVDHVKAELRSTRIDPPRLVLPDEARLPDGAFAICYENYIAVMGDGRENLEFYVTHELVHWYIDESAYAGLPHFIEEGLADWIACERVGLLDARISEMQRIGTLEIYPQYLGLDYPEWSRIPEDQQQALGRAGFDIVLRLGRDGLIEQLEAGAVPLDYLYAAGVSGHTFSDWRAELSP